MVFDLTNIDTKMFILWMKLFKKNYNNEHIAFYFYITQYMTNNRTIMLTFKTIISEFLTLKTKKQVKDRLKELSSINLFSYDINSEFLTTIKIDLSIFTLHFSTFSKNQNTATKTYLTKFFYLLKKSNFKTDVINLLQKDSKIKTVLIQIYRNYNFSLKSTDFNLDIHEKILQDMVQNRKLLQVFIEDSLKSFQNKTEDLFLTHEENTIWHKYLNVWNRIAKQNDKMTVHNVLDFTVTRASKSKIEHVNIVKKLETCNVDDLPEIFSIFKEKPLTLTIFDKSLTSFAKSLIFKKMKVKMTLPSFIFNMKNNNSWLCKFSNFETFDYEQRKHLNDVYRQYTLLLNKTNTVTAEQNQEIITIVNTLEEQFVFFTKSIFWFYKSWKKDFNLDIWKNFYNKHYDFIKDNYHTPNINILKIKVNNGKKSKSFRKFINNLRTEKGWNLDPNSQEMKLMLQKRSLFLKKSNLLAKNHKYLTEKEYIMFQNQEIILLYDDN